MGAVRKRKNGLAEPKAKEIQYDSKIHNLETAGSKITLEKNHFRGCVFGKH